MAQSGAERMRRYRARKKLSALAADGVMVARPYGNSNHRTHGVYSRDMEDAVAKRLETLPAYLTQTAAFKDATEIVFRRVERAARLGAWVRDMGEEAACTPRRAGGSTPEEISRHADDSALRGLSALGLTPQSAAKFAARLEQSLRPDLAQLAAEARLAGQWSDEGDGDD